MFAPGHAAFNIKNVNCGLENPDLLVLSNNPNNSNENAQAAKFTCKVCARLLNTALCRSAATRRISEPDAAFDFNHLKCAQYNARFYYLTSTRWSHREGYPFKRNLNWQFDPTVRVIGTKREKERGKTFNKLFIRRTFRADFVFSGRISLMRVRGDWGRTKENEKLCVQRVHMARVKANLLIGINKQWGQRSKQAQIDQKRYSAS